MRTMNEKIKRALDRLGRIIPKRSGFWILERSASLAMMEAITQAGYRVRWADPLQGPETSILFPIKDEKRVEFLRFHRSRQAKL